MINNVIYALSDYFCLPLSPNQTLDEPISQDNVIWEFHKALERHDLHQMGACLEYLSQGFYSEPAAFQDSLLDCLESLIHHSIKDPDETNTSLIQNFIEQFFLSLPKDQGAFAFTLLGIILHPFQSPHLAASCLNWIEEQQLHALMPPTMDFSPLLYSGPVSIKRPYLQDAVINVVEDEEHVFQIPLTVLKMRAPSIQHAIQQDQDAQWSFETLKLMCEFICNPQPLKEIHIEELVDPYAFAIESGCAQFIQMAESYILSKTIEWVDIPGLLNIYPLTSGTFHNQLKGLLLEQATLALRQGDSTGALQVFRKIKSLNIKS